MEQRRYNRREYEPSSRNKNAFLDVLNSIWQASQLDELFSAWTLNKYTGTGFDDIHTHMLRAVLNIFWGKNSSNKRLYDKSYLH